MSPRNEVPMSLDHLRSARFLAHRLFKPPRSHKPLHFPTSRRNLGFRSLSFCSAAMASPTPSPVPVKETIELTEKEEMIFARLLDVVRHFNLQTQLRVAGGWVRDKLLDEDCHDIDIALDNMLGCEFCVKIQEYQLHTGESVTKFQPFKSNPDQSKHLETAQMRVYDTAIDFVNLRSEIYAENSRIPTMKFGTPTEDAYRRDLTINSLFYNINSSSVEDLTGRGVQDLKTGYIVTPLPPKATFLDDPLRVLRAIRFGARFNFVLDEELKIAASDMEVRTALADKISRERIGKEIELMVSGNHPAKAMAYVCNLQLFSAVFTFPENPQPSVIEECDRLCASSVDAAWNVLQLIGYSKFSDEQRKHYLYGAFFLPVRHAVYRYRSKMKPVTHHIIMFSLKLANIDDDTVSKLHAEVDKLVSLISFLETNESSTFVDVELEDEYLDIPLASRVRVLSGLLLSKLKKDWQIALLLSTLVYSKANHVDDYQNFHVKLERARDIFLRVENIIIGLDLDQIWLKKPVLNGIEIANALKLDRGPKIGQWQCRVHKWQLAHPNGTAEDCLDWIKQSQAKRLKLDVICHPEDGSLPLSNVKSTWNHIKPSEPHCQFLE